MELSNISFNKVTIQHIFSNIQEDIWLNLPIYDYKHLEKINIDNNRVLLKDNKAVRYEQFSSNKLNNYRHSDKYNMIAQEYGNIAIIDFYRINETDKIKKSRL